MDLVVHGSCSLQHLYRESSRRSFDGHFKGVRLGNWKCRRDRVFAVSGVEKSKGVCLGTGESSAKLKEIRSCSTHLHQLLGLNKLDEGLSFLESMIFVGLVPDFGTCTGLVCGFCKTGQTRKAQQAMEIIEDAGVVLGVRTYNMLINAHCRVGEVDTALRVLDHMKVAPDIVTYNTILCYLCKCGKVEKAVEIFKQQMEKHCYPNIVTYNTLLAALCRVGKINAAMELFDQLSSKGCEPGLITYNTVIHGLCRNGKTDQALQLWHEMQEKGLNPNNKSCSSLIYGLFRDGKVDESIKLFYCFQDMGGRPDVVTYNYVIDGLCKSHLTDLAIDFLAFMVSKGCKPAESTYRILVEGIAYEGLTKEALELHDDLCARGVMTRNTANRVAFKREFVVDLVGQDGNVHGPDSTIIGVSLFSVPSPFQISHLKEFQESDMETALHQTRDSTHSFAVSEKQLVRGSKEEDQWTTDRSWLQNIDFSTGASDQACTGNKLDMVSADRLGRNLEALETTDLVHVLLQQMK